MRACRARLHDHGNDPEFARLASLCVAKLPAQRVQGHERKTTLFFLSLCGGALPLQLHNSETQWRSQHQRKPSQCTSAQLANGGAAVPPMLNVAERNDSATS